MLLLLCHQGYWKRLFASGFRSRVPVARLPLTPRHRQARLLWYRERVDWSVEWRSVVFSVNSRFCQYASDGRTRLRARPGERHIAECISPRYIGPSSGFIVCGAISYNSWSHLVSVHGKVNSTRYIAQVVNPVLLIFLRQKVKWFFSMTTHVHIRLLWRNLLFLVYSNCPGQQYPPYLS